MLTDAYEDVTSQFIICKEYETLKMQFNRNLSEAQKAMELSAKYLVFREQLSEKRASNWKVIKPSWMKTVER